jgi:hypothetical protein
MIPIILILYIVIKNIRAYLVPHFIIIFIISNIDNIFNPNPLWWKITVFFTHGILILLLIMFKPINVKNKNIGIFLLYLIAMFVIYLFPKWGYIIPRHYFMIIYSILLLVYYIIDNVQFAI